ncbi:hypothetical protein [Achromobacter xylosoxidans]|uniref:hypothetical protein n=1 Tax=Alcaligenes xylosoxydans xylosoxydans TaxID=85698 RepID=UPI001F5FEB43|nr:hypothetical protein [Achromobacter xylosoxidans]
METIFGEALSGRGQYLAAPLQLPGGIDLAHAADGGLINRLIDLSIKYHATGDGQAKG